jgi:hypothetical protein
VSRLFYMALPGVGAWDIAIKQSGAQFAPYRSYLQTARKAADQRALVLAWRRPDANERRALDQRLRDRHAEEVRRLASGPRRRDRRPPPTLPTGEWIILEPPRGRAEEPETTFDAFLKADQAHERRQWSNDFAIDIVAVDEEARALLVSREPTEVEPPTEDARQEGPGATLHGPLLFLRPNTRVVDAQRRALEKLEDRPPPRLAPLLRLVSTRGTWPDPDYVEIDEAEWMILQKRGGVLRDGTAEQREFVVKALATPDFAVLEGPPGSGKTTAICELILQLAKKGKRVLLVASTHVAVDNVLERLLAWQDEPAPPGTDPREKLVLPVRIGEETNVTSESVKPWCLGHLERTWRFEIQDHLDHPEGAEPAGVEARRMLREALARTEHRSALIRMLLDSSNLVCGTTIGILKHPAIDAEDKWVNRLNRANGAERISLLQHPPTPFEPFDMLILDEASKTTLTEFLVPASFAKRWIVVGDIRQLSPYVEEQDLAENLRGLLPLEVARAAVHAFLASDVVRPGERVSSLVAVTSDDEAGLFEHETNERAVAAVDLDTMQPTTLRGVANAVPALLFANLVYGSPDALTRWQHRLPGDLAATAGPMPPLPDWEAHRDAVGTRVAEEPPDWADEVAWRLVRAYELRQNPEDQRRLLDELKELPPKTLADWYFGWRKMRPRSLFDGATQSGQDLLQEDLANVRRVAMPSILEILQRGAGQLPGWRDETALTHGLGEHLDARVVSLHFQHRMHPDISAFPRAAFYAEDGLLNDATGMAAARAWDYSRYARRALWLDVRPAGEGRGRGSGPSNRNPAEVTAVMAELKAFVEWAQTHPRSGQSDAPWEVAVLTFYRGQEAELRKRLQAASGLSGNTRNFRFPKDNPRVHVTLCTVDRFQGHEADLVLLSFVKTHGSVGFLNSPNRLNVALTRARYQIVLVGHRAGFASDKCKSELLRELASSELYAHDLAWGER